MQNNTYTVNVEQLKKGKMNIIANSESDAYAKAKVVYDSNKELVHWIDEEAKFKNATLFRMSNRYSKPNTDNTNELFHNMYKDENENSTFNLQEILNDNFNKLDLPNQNTSIDTNWKHDFDKTLKEELEKFCIKEYDNYEKEDDSNVVVGEVDNDEVNHPYHYTDGGIECIDAMELLYGKEAVMIFCKLNAFKYLWRCGKKGDAETDINKAKWYMRHKKKLEESF